MESIKILNSTDFRILVFLFNAKEANPIESSWIDPLHPNKQRKVWASKNYAPGIYLIHTEILDEDNGIKYETSVRIDHPLTGIVLEVDDGGAFWWRINRDKEMH